MSLGLKSRKHEPQMQSGITFDTQLTIACQCTIAIQTNKHRGEEMSIY